AAEIVEIGGITRLLADRNPQEPDGPRWILPADQHDAQDIVSFGVVGMVALDVTRHRFGRHEIALAEKGQCLLQLGDDGIGTLARLRRRHFSPLDKYSAPS